MATKTARADRTDPKQNKSEAIRQALAKHPKGKAADIIAEVEEKHGHKVTPTLVYLVKSKTGKAKPAKTSKQAATVPVDAIRAARKFLDEAGDYATASTLLAAVGK